MAFCAAGALPSMVRLADVKDPLVTLREIGVVAPVRVIEAPPDTTSCRPLSIVNSGCTALLLVTESVAHWAVRGVVRLSPTTQSWILVWLTTTLLVAMGTSASSQFRQSNQSWVFAPVHKPFWKVEPVMRKVKPPA